jgi:small subunit ribosomal protein S6e
MVEFKVVVNDVKKGKSHQVQVSGHHANSLIGKKIGDEVDGIFISLPGYKLQITGGTDKDGFTMRKDFPGMGRRRLLLSEGLGFKPTEEGMRKKKSVRGNTINQDVVQINMKVVKYSSRSIDQILSVKKEDEQEEKVEEKEEKPTDKKPEELPKEKTKEETKEEKKDEEKKEEKKEEE